MSYLGIIIGVCLIIDALLVVWLLRHHNARAVIFVTAFTLGLGGLVTSLALVAMLRQKPADYSTFILFHTTQYASLQFPDKVIFLAALAAMVAIAAGAIMFEIIAAQAHNDPRKAHLLPIPRDFHHHRTQKSKIKITVLIPAHNEEKSLPATLHSLGTQTRPPEQIIVVCDNCTDKTSEVANSMGATAFLTKNNKHRKGGALNQVLSQLLPDMGPGDLVLVMDADSQINNEFLEEAVNEFEKNLDLDAVGGVFYGEPGHGLLGQFQRNEYIRYSAQIKLRRGRVFVLTGTASLFRADALLSVARARGIYIPGIPGQVYDTTALTEDNELTIALKSLGCPMISPANCRVTTELMPTWKNLWVQRKRWQRGALENLGAYGMTKATIRYWGQQIGIAYGTIALISAIGLSVFMMLAQDRWTWYPFWIITGFIFFLERVYTVRKGGAKAVLLAAPVFPEIFFDFFLQLVFVKVILDIARMKRTTWGHVQHGELKPLEIS